MQAIILGAGRGTRLGKANPGLPKPLLQVGSELLLHRQLRVLRTVFPDIAVITVVVGFKAQLVRELGGDQLRYVENAAFASTNTAASLHLALTIDRQDAVLLNGDVFCDSAAMMALERVACGAVCDFKPAVDPEEVQVCVRPDNVIERIGKDISGVAEAVGIYRLSAEFVDAYLRYYSGADGSRYYEDVFNRIIQGEPHDFCAAPLAGGLAVEIDTEEDLHRARNLAAVVDRSV